MPSKKILVIVGPTASGKTRMAVELAKAHNGEVVSADSMQIYRRMDIGTAKPTAEEMDGVPHHMIDVADPEEDFSVARYVEMASACVDGILSRGKLPILVGGTGLYIDNLVAGRTFAPFSGLWRQRLQDRARAEGIGALYAQLQAVDSILADLDLTGIPRVMLLNKWDAADEDTRAALLAAYPDALPVSALTGKGLDAAARVMERRLFDPTDDDAALRAARESSTKVGDSEKHE